MPENRSKQVRSIAGSRRSGPQTQSTRTNSTLLEQKSQWRKQKAPHIQIRYVVDTTITYQTSRRSFARIGQPRLARVHRSADAVHCAAGKKKKELRGGLASDRPIDAATAYHGEGSPGPPTKMEQHPSPTPTGFFKRVGTWGAVK